MYVYMHLQTCRLYRCLYRNICIYIYTVHIYIDMYMYISFIVRGAAKEHTSFELRDLRPSAALGREKN